jgi:hypothetical protein
MDSVGGRVFVQLVPWDLRLLPVDELHGSNYRESDQYPLFNQRPFR